MGITPKGKYVTAAGAKAGDQLILTKSAGVEGTAILASDRETELKKTLSQKELQNAQDFYKRISVVKDALTACKAGGVHAMHDPTEGGIAGGAHEMADAASLGLKVFRENRKPPKSVTISTWILCNLSGQEHCSSQQKQRKQRK